MSHGLRNRWRANFLRAEFILAVVGGLATAGWGYWLGGFEVLDAILGRNRAEVYGSLATIFGSLLGFVVVAVSVVLSAAQSDRMAVIRDSDQYDTLWDVFVGTIKSLAFATVVALLALIMDRPDSPVRWIEVVGVFATLLAALRLWRSVWVLEKVIGLVTSSSDSDGD